MKSKESSLLSMGLAVGVGASIGILTDNIGLWLSLGVALGAAMRLDFSNANSNHENED